MHFLKSKIVPEKKSCTAGTGKPEKTLFEMYQNKTVIWWLTNLKKKNIYSFSFQNFQLFKKKIEKNSSLICRGSDPPPPLVDCPAKNVIF